VEIHDRLGFVVLVVAVAGALLSVLALLRPRLMPTVRVYLRLELLTVALQVVVGLVLLLLGERPSQLLHWFYGAATLLALPLATVIGRGRGVRDETVWIVGGAVATVLFAFRAVSTG